ncbi:MAG: DUF1949 domain-containing protein [Clostridiales bacterium]|nr:DUF1949 domain-containing protein [Clostridiales bacterium]
MLDIFTVKKQGYAEIIEKRSKFIANVYPVSSQAEASDIISKLKKQYYDAKHNVYAYIIEGSSTYSKYTDDGEPQGTAGLPIYEMLQKQQLVNVLVVVTRYFGGILLGTGGLVRAYTEAAKQGLKNAEIKQVIKTKKITFEFSYELKDKILFYLKKEEYEDKEILYGENVRIIINIPEEDEKIFLEKLIEITEARVNFIES